MSDSPPQVPPQLNYASEPRQPLSALSIVSLVLGAIATPLDYACELGLIFGILAIFTGVFALERIKERNQRGRVFAQLGIIFGVIALLVGIGCGIYVTSRIGAV